MTEGHATGRIEVQTWEPQQYDDTDSGPNLVEVHVTETFSGDIQGQGKVRFLQTVRADGSASFVGVERVSGTLADRTGTFVLQDQGTLEGSHVNGTWFVVPGSGTGDLTGLRGEGRFEAELGQHADITLDWRIDA
ncbi:MAG: DUF3224 domain-containing protein [Chloroflexi bacterium]|nr:DUF3224 domain-containing protein [Chloroflexota bacterium]MBV9598407.1 DUF3224 domain-containing protein [Chloroflexota bacterium]